MTRALLLGLRDEADARSGQFGANLVCLMTDYREDPVSRRKRERGPDHMLGERKPSGAMQHLGLLGLHPRAQPRGKNYDVDRNLHIRFLS